MTNYAAFQDVPEQLDLEEIVARCEPPLQASFDKDNPLGLCVHAVVELRNGSRIKIESQHDGELWRWRADRLYWKDNGRYALSEMDNERDILRVLSRPGEAQGDELVAQGLADLTEQVGDNQDRLDRLSAYVGICHKCETELVHDMDEPFAQCKCGTTEWTIAPPVLSRLSALEARVAKLETGMFGKICQAGQSPAPAQPEPQGCTKNGCTTPATHRGVVGNLNVYACDKHKGEIEGATPIVPAVGEPLEVGDTEGICVEVPADGEGVRLTFKRLYKFEKPYAGRTFVECKDDTGCYSSIKASRFCRVPAPPTGSEPELCNSGPQTHAPISTEAAREIRENVKNLEASKVGEHKFERLPEGLTAELVDARSQLAAARADAVVSHRWFAEQFGKLMEAKDAAENLNRELGNIAQHWQKRAEAAEKQLAEAVGLLRNIAAVDVGGAADDKLFSVLVSAEAVRHIRSNIVAEYDSQFPAKEAST